jgi:hypothetical protein
MCTGRYGPRLFEQDPDTPIDMIFRRLEFGVRIQQPASSAFFSSYITPEQIDPKFKIVDPFPETKTEFRTFCAVQRGQVCPCLTQGFQTLSGRADCRETQWSNIGFNARVKSPKASAEILLALTRSAEEARRTNVDMTFRIPLTSVLDETVCPLLASRYGEQGSAILQRGIRALAQAFPSLGEDALAHQAWVLGPTLEGVGRYPELLDNLQSRNAREVWFAGDVCGIFRGIVAAMVSGAFIGKSLAQNLVAENQPLGRPLVAENQL